MSRSIVRPVVIVGRAAARRVPLVRATPSRWLAALWSRVAATDPGLLRLLLAVRGTLSVGLTAAVTATAAGPSSRSKVVCRCPRTQVRLSGLSVLRSLRDVVQASVAAMDGGECLAPIEAVRRLDRQIADLRIALVPLTAGRFIMRRARVDRPVTALLACAETARALAASSARAEAGRVLPALRRQADRIEVRIAAMLAGTAQPSTVAEVSGGPVDGPAGEALRRLDLALSMLSERLDANLLDGFALD